jgi:hypothetical protein
MKTAEQWRIEIKDNDCMAFNGSLDRCIKAIQDDARISALEEVAEICEVRYKFLETPEYKIATGACVVEILSLATKLKEGTK